MSKSSSQYLRGFPGLLRRIADRIDPDGAPHYISSHTFTFERGEGIRFRTDGKGCPLWYLGEDDYKRAHTEADSATAEQLNSPPVELATPADLEAVGPVPDRDHLMGKPVRIALNPWASSSGPTEGIFLGQGEKGLGIRVVGGGRYTYRHYEVARVDPV